MTTLKLGELLRRHRMDAELSQKQLADLIGYDHSMVSRVERDRRDTTPEYIERFIAELHLAEAEKQEIWALFDNQESDETETLSVIRRTDWGAALEATLRGRDHELSRLSTWVLREQCRLVAVLGLGGIGKTALTTTFARHVAAQFDFVIWRSFQNAPLLPDILADCVHLFSQQQQTEMPASISKSISLLLDYMRRYRCLIIFDNLESVLQAEQPGQFLPEFEGLNEIISRVSLSDHQSCLLLTSRERPIEITLLTGKQTPSRVLPLSGLNSQEGMELLQDAGLRGSPTELLELTNHFSGRPLALKLVSGTIQELYGGDVAAFLNDTAASTTATGFARDPLEQQFDRLLPLECLLVYWLAVEREPISLPGLRSNLVNSPSVPQLQQALVTLAGRSLIEARNGRFSLHPVVMDYVTTQLVQQFITEIEQVKPKLLHQIAICQATTIDEIRESQRQLIVKPVLDGLLQLSSQSRADLEQKLTACLVYLRQDQPNYPNLCAMKREKFDRTQKLNFTNCNWINARTCVI